MTEIRIGYARCSTDKQDLTDQQEALVKLSVSPARIYTDKGLTGSYQQRPGLEQVLAAVTPWLYRNLTVWRERYLMRVKLRMHYRLEA